MKFITKRIILASLYGLMAHAVCAMDCSNSRSESPNLPQYPTFTPSQSTSPVSKLPMQSHDLATLERLRIAKKEAHINLIRRLHDELDAATVLYKEELTEATRIKQSSTAEIAYRAGNPFAAIVHAAWHASGVYGFISQKAAQKASDRLRTIENDLCEAYRELEILNSEIHIIQLSVIQQKGNACGFHAATNARAIDLLTQANANICAESVTLYADALNVQECPADIMRNDNEIMDYLHKNTRRFPGYPEGLGLDNIYMLGRLDGRSDLFAITCYKENGIIHDERPDMELISEAYNLNVHAIDQEVAQDVFNLQKPIINLKQQVMERGRGAVHFILGCPGHYVHASIVKKGDEAPHIFYTDSLNASLEERTTAYAMIRYIKTEFERFAH